MPGPCGFWPLAKGGTGLPTMFDHYSTGWAAAVARGTDAGAGGVAVAITVRPPFDHFSTTNRPAVARGAGGGAGGAAVAITV